MMMTLLPYHLHLTSEVTPRGTVVYCAEHTELPCVAFGLSVEEAVDKLAAQRVAYFQFLTATGQEPPPFTKSAHVYNWLPKAHQK